MMMMMMMMMMFLFGPHFVVEVVVVEVDTVHVGGCRYYNNFVQSPPGAAVDVVVFVAAPAEMKRWQHTDC